MQTTAKTAPEKPAWKGRVIWTVILVVLAIVGLEIYQSFESQFLSEMATKQLEDSASGYATFRFFARNTIPNWIYLGLVITVGFVWVPFFLKVRKLRAQNEQPAEN